MVFCFSGSLLRANFSIVSLFFLFDGVIVRGKKLSSSFFFLSDIAGLDNAGLRNNRQGIQGITYPSYRGCLPLKLFDTLQHRHLPPLEGAKSCYSPEGVYVILI